MANKKETNNCEDRINDTYDKEVLIIIGSIMSDFIEAVKMLTGTMEAQLEIIKEQERNNIEATRLHNETINRQLHILENQHEFLKIVFQKIGVDEKKIPRIVEMFKSGTN